MGAIINVKKGKVGHLYLLQREILCLFLCLWNLTHIVIQTVTDRFLQNSQASLL